MKFIFSKTQTVASSEQRRKRFSCAVSLLVGLVSFSGPSSWASERSGPGLSKLFEESVSFSGRLHPQYDSLESDLAGTDMSSPGPAKRDYFRRLFVGAKVELGDRLRVNYLTDLSDRIVKNQIARLEWVVSDASKCYFGYQKVPFGFEDTTSSSNVKPIERSANTRFWNEVVGIGSYHSGLYHYHSYGDGVSSVLGVTHNVKSDTKVPNVISGDVSLYSRISKKGETYAGSPFQTGLDIAFQPSDVKGDTLAASAFGNVAVAEYEFALEATAGEIDLSEGGAAFAVGWHAQVSRMFGDRLEGVVRVSQVDTGGYQLKLSSAIRKAPYSGYKYEEIDSLYLGANYFIRGNEVKLSLGYELAEGRDALLGVGPLADVEELVSGFRVRGQFMF